MAAGEYVSVSSQQELLEANSPNPDAGRSVPKLDVEENELALVYRARGMSSEEAAAKAQRVFESIIATDRDEKRFPPSRMTLKLKGKRRIATVRGYIEFLPFRDGRADPSVAIPVWGTRHDGGRHSVRVSRAIFVAYWRCCWHSFGEPR